MLKKYNQEEEIIKKTLSELGLEKENIDKTIKKAKIIEEIGRASCRERV